LRRGYSNTSVQEVLNELDLPKGCFYHYFDSKETFAVAIIHHFDTTYAATLMEILLDTSRKPLERLRQYCDSSKAMLVAQECRNGCLIGNLSQEMADQSEILRKELSDVMSKWRTMFAKCLEEGQSAGEITSNRSAHDLAEFFSSAWSGAVMTAKTVKSSESLDVFIELMFNDILKA
jgi:TetR/AcrR family transcriptional repressor of nem operon